ncbi:MAG: metal ABC transporter permease [Lautropia sp.]|nr:metal ABC transporter permease [Lautropia sp.]
MSPELLAPLEFYFMQHALLIAVLVAIPTALLSCFLVMKGWALLGDAISHAVFPGVVLAHMVGLPLPVGAFVAGMSCALLSGYVHDNSRIKQDTVMGIVFSSMFALGLLLHAVSSADMHLDQILFGDVLGVQPEDLIETGSIALLISLGMLLKWRDLLLNIFDPIQARTSGLPVQWLHYGLLAAVSLAVVGALKSVGIVLTIALLIAPGAIALLLTRTFGQMLWVAVLATVLASVGGIYLSFFLDSAPAPTIVVLLTLFFLLALLVDGWKTRRLRRAQAFAPSSSFGQAYAASAHPGSSAPSASSTGSTGSNRSTAAITSATSAPKLDPKVLPDMVPHTTPGEPR